MHAFLLIILFLFSLSFAQEQALEQQSEADKRKELLGTINVSRVHSLDDAKGKYKSPRRAMFMSLILPGSGQIYVGGRQSRYVRGAFYLLEEAALISGLYYHSVYKYDKQVKKYKAFADLHFDVETYESNMNKIFIDDPKYIDLFNRYYGYERENYCKAFYGNSNAKQLCVEDFGRISSRNPNNSTSIYNSSDYYRVIANEVLIMGWDDVDNADTQLDLVKAALYQDQFVTPLGTSKNFNEYQSLRKKASDLADKQAIFLGAIILNHIVSAVDAALSAKAHNNSLYEEKVSFLDKIRLGSDFYAGENFRAGAGLWYSF